MVGYLTDGLQCCIIKMAVAKRRATSLRGRGFDSRPPRFRMAVAQKGERGTEARCGLFPAQIL